MKPITLAYRTHLGRDVVGIEIARNPFDTRDGKPIFFNMGVHHAREWPSSEHAIEWAYDLLRNYGKSNRTTRLVNATRNIVVPVVNPDGFNISREGTRPPGTPEPFGRFDYEMKRKNCRPDPANPGPCEQQRDGGRAPGRRPEPQLRHVLGRRRRVREPAGRRPTAAPARSPSRRARTCASWWASGR